MAEQMSTPGGDAEEVSMLLDDQLCFALYSTTNSIQRLYRPLLAELDLTYPQYLVLLVLWETDDIAVSTIGQRLSLTSATLTPLLKRMEAAGLVVRRRAGDDERRVNIALTDRGRTIRSQVGRVTTEVTCAATEASGDVAALLRALTELRDRLSEF